MKEFMQKIPTWARLGIGGLLFAAYLYANSVDGLRTGIFIVLFAAWTALCLTIKCKPENQTQFAFVVDENDPNTQHVPKQAELKQTIIIAAAILIVIAAMFNDTENPNDADAPESSHKMTYSEAVAAYNRYRDNDDLTIYEEASFVVATSILLDISVEEVQKIKYAFEQVGQDVGVGFDGMRHLKKQLDKIYAGDEDLLKTFRRYGVQPYDENGAERYLVDVFYDAIDMLSEME